MSFKSKSDDELMQRVAKGENQAFSALFDRHAHKVLGYATRLLSDRHRAEDLTQEVWMKVVKAAPSYQASGHFVAWLYTLIRNAALTELKRGQKWSQDKGISEVNESDFDLVANDLEEIMLRQSDIKRVQNAIGELPDSQRTVLVAWITEDLSYEELAVWTGLSLSAVKSLLFRARRTLESQLREAS